MRLEEKCLETKTLKQAFEDTFDKRKTNMGWAE